MTFSLPSTYYHGRQYQISLRAVHTHYARICAICRLLEDQIGLTLVLSKRKMNWKFDFSPDTSDMLAVVMEGGCAVVCRRYHPESRRVPNCRASKCLARRLYFG